MVFSSLPFLYFFLPAVLIFYYAVPRKFKNLILFFCSLFFYAWGEPIYIGIMLFSTVFDYINGRLLERFDESLWKRRLVLIVSVVGNLAILGFFKYADFLIGNVNMLLGLNIPLTDLPLPIGISFYTFQTMSYTIDVYRRTVKAQHNIISFGTYVTLFPQLIAGPIVRYVTVAKELDFRKETFNDFADGVVRFCIGLSKKVLLANNIGMLWDTVKATPVGELSVLSAWLGIIAFAFQIYFDFSGYSDMAIGLGRMFGFHFLENFHYPYISKSITEFWRRWHISLSTWFKEYVYIPLGGNRVKLPRMYLNIFMVWLLTGFWHGASWNFAVWGLFFGILLVIEKTFLLKWLEKLPGWIGHVYTLVMVLVSWVIFSFDQLSDGFAYLGVMFGTQGAPLLSSQFLYQALSNLPVLLILVIACLPYPASLARAILTKHPKAASAVPVLCLLALLLCTAYLVDSTYNPFLYFRF